MNIFQTLLETVGSKTLSPEDYSRLYTESLAEYAEDYRRRLDQAVSDEGPFEVFIPHLTNSGEIIKTELGTILENASAATPIISISTPVYSENGDLLRTEEWLVDTLEEAVLKEIDVARIQADIISTFRSMPTNANLSSVIAMIKDICNTASTGAGQYIGDAVNQIATRVTSIPELIRNVTVFIASRDEAAEVFAPTTLGANTGTLGWNLFAKYVADRTNEVISEAIPSLRRFFMYVFAFPVYAMDFLWRKVYKPVLGYGFSKFWDDEWVSFNSEYEELSFANGFIDLGQGDSDFAAAARAAGVTENAAMRIPTLGATWYVFAKNGRYRLGLSKHIYNINNEIILQRIGATGNTWADVLEMGLDIQPYTSNAWLPGSVRDFNEATGVAFRKTSHLIGSGLLILGGEEIANRYLQDPNGPWTYIKMGWDSGNSLDSRSALLSEAMYAGSSQAIDFAFNMIERYLNNVSSDTTEYVWHVFCANTAAGAYSLVDDAKLLDDYTAAAVTTTVLVAGVAIAIIGFKAGGKVKQVARTAVTEATRAATDSGTSIFDAVRLKRKADILSVIAGIPTGAASLVSPLPIAKEIISSIGSSRDVNLNTIQRLITG